MTGRGKFITFDGIDGAGKTTHLGWFRDRLAERAAARGVTVLATREPGGTRLGEALRDIVLHEPMHLETEALLMFAARREHLDKVIEPALARGDWVLSDRFSDATFAYQGGGRGLSAQRLDVLEHWVQGELRPDLTILFDVPVRLAGERRSASHPTDKFERESDAFFSRAREAYLARAQAHPARYAIVDTSAPVRDVRTALDAILARLP